VVVRRFQGREWLIGGIALAALIAAFVVVYLVLRGGGDDAPSEQITGSPTPGTPGVLTAASLPGDGWTSSETELVSLFDSPDAVFPATPTSLSARQSRRSKPSCSRTRALSRAARAGCSNAPSRMAGSCA